MDNIIFVGNTGFEASDDRIIILQDDFRSGYECSRCLGKDIRNEVSYVPCESCSGSGKSALVKGAKCTHCEGRQVMPCPDCGGRGGLLVMPENTKGRPTTGKVVSVGKDIAMYKLGDKLCYPSFAGHGFDLAGVDDAGRAHEATIVILSERDILAKVHGVLEKKNIKRSMALSTGA